MKLLEKIRSAETKVRSSKRRTAWYRGQANSSWGLFPRLLRRRHARASVLRLENGSFADFRGDARRFIRTEYLQDSWDYLAAMQHYGIATRLLDWTTELDIAIYFAVSSVKSIDMRSPQSWPCIWVLNPYRLNSLYSSDLVIFDRADEIPYDYYAANVSSLEEGASWPHMHPIAINTGFSNDRILAQHGRFTVHGERMAPLTTFCEAGTEFWSLEKVVIDPNDWGELKKSSVMQAPMHMRVYPDIEGYALTLNQKMRV